MATGAVSMAILVVTLLVLRRVRGLRARVTSLHLEALCEGEPETPLKGGGDADAVGVWLEADTSADVEGPEGNLFTRPLPLAASSGSSLLSMASDSVLMRDSPQLLLPQSSPPSFMQPGTSRSVYATLAAEAAREQYGCAPAVGFACFPAHESPPPPLPCGQGQGEGCRGRGHPDQSHPGR